MLQIERQNYILQWLHEKRFLSTAEIANHFKVSQMTSWRDIEDLENHGLAKRVHGGLALPDWSLGDMAISPGSSSQSQTVFEFPESIYDPRCLALGRYAAEKFVHPGDDLILEGGSTVACLIPYIDAENVTIITNGLNTIALAQAYKTVQTVLCCGGVLNQPNAIFIGPQAENFFLSYRVDRTFISAFGVTVKDGFVDPSPIYDSMKRVMCRSARQRIVMMDSRKIGRTALSRVMGLNEIDILITNDDADPNIIAAIRSQGVDVRLV